MMAATPVLDASCAALIFRASRGSVHHGALATARTLGRLGVPVYAVVEGAWSPLALCRYLTKKFIWRSWPSNREEFFEIISTIRRIIGRPTVLIPLDDLSAVFTAEHSEVLQQWYFLPHVPRDLPRKMANKANMYTLCANVGIPCVRSRAPNGVDDVRGFAEEAGFPIVAKAAEQWRLINNQYNVSFIKDEAALARFCKHLGNEHFSRLILQEYIPGEDWIYHGYADPSANLWLSFTGRKLLGYPSSGGSTAIGVAVNNELIRTQSEALIKAVSYAGITDMDWRFDDRDGQYKLLDCNPRVGQNFRLFENEAGIDVVRAQHLNLTGRAVACAPMRTPRRFKVESFCALSFMRFGPPRKIKDDRLWAIGKTELAWWSSEDPMPFFVMSIRLLLRLIGRLLTMMARTTGLLSLVNVCWSKVSKGCNLRAS